MKALNMLRLTFIIVLISLLRTDGIPVLGLIKGAASILELGLTIKGVLDELDAGEEVDADLGRITSTLSERIDSSTTKIITNVLLQSKLERIDDAVINIHSSLVDLRYIFHETSPNERKEYAQIFVNRFEEHDVIKHLRFLPELLEYNIPGTTGSLLQLYADQTRCNMTAFNEFKLYYFNLISDGIALQITHVQLTSSLSIKLITETWTRRYDNMKYIFDEQNSKCVDTFDDYAAEDIEAANETTTLWNHNNERYTWKTNDVMFLPPYGTHQFIYFDHSSDLFHLKSDKNKFAIFSDKTDVNPGSSILSHETEFIKSAIAGEMDKSAAKNVATAVKSRLQDRGYKIKNILVFFDGQEFTSDTIIIDKESPVIRVTLHGVTLSYCYKSGVECTLSNIDFLNVFNGRHYVSGKMEVFAYVSSGSSYTVLKTGGAAPNATLPLFSYILLAVCLQIGIGYGYVERFY